MLMFPILCFNFFLLKKYNVAAKIKDLPPLFSSLPLNHFAEIVVYVFHTSFETCTYIKKMYHLLMQIIKGMVFVSFGRVQFSTVTQSCPTLCDPMNRSTPGLPVHQQLPEFIQTHVHRVGDAIQPSHPLSSPSPPTSNPSQHQSLFQ